MGALTRSTPLALVRFYCSARCSIYYLPMLRRIEQAGAVTFRMTAEGPEFLLVRSRKNPEHWIFPKGHIERGESAEATATRELQEEAGVVGDVVDELGSVRFQLGFDDYHVRYYLYRFRQQINEGEGRERQWRLQQPAVELLTFEDLQRLVNRAVDKLSPEASS